MLINNGMKKIDNSGLERFSGGSIQLGRELLLQLKAGEVACDAHARYSGYERSHVKRTAFGFLVIKNGDELPWASKKACIHVDDFETHEALSANEKEALRVLGAIVYHSMNTIGDIRDYIETKKYKKKPGTLKRQVESGLLTSFSMRDLVREYSQEISSMYLEKETDKTLYIPARCEKKLDKISSKLIDLRAEVFKYTFARDLLVLASERFDDHLSALGAFLRLFSDDSCSFSAQSYLDELNLFESEFDWLRRYFNKSLRSFTNSSGKRDKKLFYRRNRLESKLQGVYDITEAQRELEF